MIASQRPLLGKVGEMLAAEYLKKSGYAILEKNYRCPMGEIDLVADHRGTLVFVEVRTKSSNDFGSPLETIGRAKRFKLWQAAAHYLTERGVYRDTMRFDAVGILLAEGAEPVIELAQNAFTKGEI